MARIGAASIPDGGTPGSANPLAATDTAPLILDVIHTPAIPRSSEPVTITAQILDQTTSGITATLFWRADDGSFHDLPMQDDGQHGDGAAGDSVYGATIPAQADLTVVEFYVHATDATNHMRTWPAPAVKMTTIPVTPPIQASATARALIPTDASLGTAWTGVDEPFDDSAWTAGTTGVGYENGQIGSHPVLPISYWTFDELTSDGRTTRDELGRYDGVVRGPTLTSGDEGRFGEALSFDGNNDYVLAGVVPELSRPSAFSVSLWFQRSVDHAGEDIDTSHFVNNVLIAQASKVSNDNLEIGTEEGFVEVYLDTEELVGNIDPVRHDSSIVNDVWHHLAVTYDSDEESELNIYVDGTLVHETSDFGGLVSSSASPFSIGQSRPGTSSSFGGFEGLIDDVAIWTDALDPSQVSALWGGTSPLLLFGYKDLIGLDVQDEILNKNTSAYVRIPFTVDVPTSLHTLTLKMRYGDAFVAYINGTEVARSNLTGAARWNAAADTDRPDQAAFSSEEYIFSNRPGLLKPGPNILAIQSLNATSDALRLLVLPELETPNTRSQETNALYQVLDALAPTGNEDPTGPPIYHQTMTPADRESFATQNQGSDAQQHATFIAMRGTEIEVRYNAGVRVRGSGSRSANPRSNRINLASDRPWNGVTELNINSPDVDNQIAGSKLFQLAGLQAAEAISVFMYSNGQNLKINKPYAHLEVFNSEFAENHYPSDAGGNLYRGRRRGQSPFGGQGAGLQYWGTDLGPYVSYQKQTHRSAADWSDVRNLTFQLNESPDATFLDDVAEVVDIDQWLRFLALNMILDNAETSLVTGDTMGDDYAMYRGVTDPRFQMVPHDLDTLFGDASSSFLRFTPVPALNRLVNHVDVIPRYAAHMWDLMNNGLSSDAVGPVLDDALRDVESQAEINAKKDYLVSRRNFLNSRLIAPVSFSSPGGSVDPGFQVTLSAPRGVIYYTTDASDPRMPGGGVSPQAIPYDGQPIVVDETTRIIARAFRAEGVSGPLPIHWSGETNADFVSSVSGLVVSEINYNPHDAQPGEIITDHDNYEFVELMNVATNPIDLDGMQFVQVNVNGDPQGIDFTFGAQTLNPGERIVAVKDRTAFESRYGGSVTIASGNDGTGGVDGQFGGQISNAGERVSLVDANGITIVSFGFDDQGNWPGRADGDGSSLELIDPTGPLSDPNNWRASTELGGTPGTAGVGPLSSVVVNEVFTRTDLLAVDAIELYNPTSVAMDISGWWLSDSTQRFNKFVIPAGTVIPADDYVVFDEGDFNSSGNATSDFALNGTAGDDVWLLARIGTETGPVFFIDHVEFGAALADESFGRWPNGTGQLQPMTRVTLQEVNSGPRIGPVVISEVMYHPPDPGDGSDPQNLEFVELYNPTAKTVDLTGWEVNGIGFAFRGGTSIGPGQTLVVVPFGPLADTAAIANFNAAYGVDILAERSRYVGPYPGQLDDDGERLTLFRAADALPALPQVIQDQVSYDDVPPWSAAADGQGQSLHRQFTDHWGGDPNNWTGGTPSPGSIGPNHDFRLESVTTVIGEIGRVTNVTHQEQVIPLSHTFQNPVVFASPASFAGADPVVVRVTDVRADQFTIFVAEPSNLNGLHNAAETVSYLVMEAGTHRLEDGAQLDVGTVTTNADSGTRVTDEWVRVDFAKPFPAFPNSPSVFHQIQTTNGDPYLQTRLRSFNERFIELSLQQEEARTANPVAETIGYFAIESGSGTWSGTAYEAVRTGFAMTDQFKRIDFEQTFSAPPNLLASLSSVFNIDNAHLRYTNLDTVGVELKVDEDTTADAETSHTQPEPVAYLALEGSGLLTAAGLVIGDGQTRTFTLDVPELGRVSDVNVKLDLSHPQAGDLEAVLMGPAGNRVELFSALAGTSGDLSGTSFDDEAPRSINSSTAPFEGRFQPTGNLSDFRDTNAMGTWTLDITDVAANGVSGALLGWSLEIDPAPQPPGNLNSDSRVDQTDIDLLYANLGTLDPTFDLDADGDADREDVRHLVESVMGKRFGDANLDQKINVGDVNILATHFDPLGTNPHNGWARADFDGDGDVDIADFNQLVRNYAPGGYPAPVTIDEMSLSQTESGITSATLLEPIDVISDARPPEASSLPTSEVDTFMAQIGSRREQPNDDDDVGLLAFDDELLDDLVVSLI